MVSEHLSISSYRSTLWISTLAEEILHDRDEKYIYTYFQSRLTQVLYTHLHPKDPLWNKGDFASQSVNDTLASNPWANSTSTTGNAPFDQEFYLILNVAVGAKNGWFA